MKRIVVAAAAGLAFFSAGYAFAAQTGYFSRYDGAWQGGGMVKLDDIPAPLNVSCSVKGNQGSQRSFTLAGKCRALLVMSRAIGARIAVDPASGLYTGVYTGSSSGPAKLVGKRKGDILELEVTWGRKIYDDNKARMLIRNSGGKTFRMQVVDQIAGKPVTVSDLSFERG